MRQTFQSGQRAALPVVKLALEGPSAFGGDGSALHFHMSEPRNAAAEAADTAIGQWLWEMTGEALKRDL